MTPLYPANHKNQVRRKTSWCSFLFHGLPILSFPIRSSPRLCCFFSSTKCKMGAAVVHGLLLFPCYLKGRPFKHIIFPLKPAGSWLKIIFLVWFLLPSITVWGYGVGCELAKINTVGSCIVFASNLLRDNLVKCKKPWIDSEVNMCYLTCTGKVTSISSNHTSPSQNRPHFTSFSHFIFHLTSCYHCRTNVTNRSISWI